MSEKYCKRCDRTLPIWDFHKDKNSKDGHAFYCKKCTYTLGKKYRHTPRGIYKCAKTRQTYYRRHNDPRMKPFKISLNWFLEWYASQEKKCVYCNIPEELLSVVDDIYNNKCTNLTLDCMDNDKGYTEKNLVLSCLRCNYTKSNLLSFDEMYEIGQKYFKPKWQQNIKISFDNKL